MADIEIASFDFVALPRPAGFLVFALERGGEAALDVGERDPPLGPLGAGERRDDRIELELERVREDGVGRAGEPEKPLRFRVGLDERDALGFAARHCEVVERLAVDGEEPACRAVLGRHVGDRRAVGERQVIEAGPEELDELVDHALPAQHLRHGEHEVRGRHAFLQRARELEADHLGDQHRLRLAEHGRFRFDAADAPAENRRAR